MDKLNLSQFKEVVNLSRTEICRELYHENRDSIRIKKETVAVGNLARIVDATLRLANQKGFQGMSLRDLSTEAGMSMGGVYAYIRNKGELLRLIRDHGYRITMRVLNEQVSRADGVRERLAVAIRSHLFLSEILRAWFYFAYMETKNLSGEEKHKAVRAELATEAIYRDLILEGQRQGIFRDTDASLTSACIKAMLQDWYLKHWKYRERDIDVDTYATFVQEVVERHLLEPEDWPAPAAGP